MGDEKSLVEAEKRTKRSVKNFIKNIKFSHLEELESDTKKDGSGIHIFGKRIFHLTKIDVKEELENFRNSSLNYTKSFHQFEIMEVIMNL